MYIESVRNRGSPPAVLLRESYREGGKVCKRTLANLSCLADEVIEGLKVLLRGGAAVANVGEVFTIERSLPHGNVAAVLGSARAAGATSWFGAAPKELQPLLLALLTARVMTPASKLATHRFLHDDTANSSLGRVLGVGQCSADDLYRALDWLHQAQPVIERRLARQHLVGSTLVLYDLTSTWLTGRCCELAARRPFARWQARRSADRLWPNLHRAGLPDSGGSVPWQHGRSGHRGGAGDQATRALRHRAHRVGGRPRHVDLGTDRERAQAAGHGLGEFPARAADRAAGRRARALPAVAVR